MSSDTDPRWLSRKQAQRKLGLSEQKLDQLIATGEIRSFKIGAKRVIPESAIEELEQRKLAEGA